MDAILNSITARQTQMISELQRMNQHMVEGKTLIVQNADTQTQMISELQTMNQHMVENKTLIVQNADAQRASLQTSTRSVGTQSVSPVSRGFTKITSVYSTQPMPGSASANRDCSSIGCTLHAVATRRSGAFPRRALSIVGLAAWQFNLLANLGSQFHAT